MHSKIQWKIQTVPIYRCPHESTASPTMSILYQRGTFITLVNLPWRIIITQSP